MYRLNIYLYNSILLCVALCKYETSSFALYMEGILQHGAEEDIWS